MQELSVGDVIIWTGNTASGSRWKVTELASPLQEAVTMLCIQAASDPGDSDRWTVGKVVRERSLAEKQQYWELQDPFITWIEQAKQDAAKQDVARSNHV